MSKLGWRATTASGRVYEHVGRGIKISGAAGEYFPNWTLTVFSYDDVPGSGSIIETLRHLPSSDRPEVGKHMFINSSGGIGWRISTRVVRVEDVFYD